MLLHLVAALLAAPSVDAPVAPVQPTIRSEIRRGIDAAWDCQKFGSLQSLQVYQDCIRAAQSQNRQRVGTSFEAFDVGLYRVARDHMADAVKVISSSPPLFDVDLAKAGLDVEEAGYQQSRKALGLTEQQVESVVTAGR